MNFLDTALRIQSEIQSLPMETIGFQSLESKQESSVRISHLIERETKTFNLDFQNRLIAEFDGLGPLTPLFEDQSITEIIVNAKDQIWYEKGGKLFPLEDRFASDLTYQNFIDRVCQESKSQVSIERPFCDGKFRNFRLHIAAHCLDNPTYLLNFRRQSLSPWTFQRIASLNWAPASAIDHIKSWIHSGKNFLVIGETGSGKTSILNACLQEIPSTERALLLEDTSELAVPSGASTKMLCRVDANGVLPPVDLTELVKQSLRMRPDRLVVGEVRGGEAKDLLLALSTGHHGSMGTMHASSAQQALLRLEMLVQLGAPHWSLTTIRRLMGLSLQGLMVVGKDSAGNRRLKSLHEISAVEESGILLDCHFQADSF